MLDQRTELLLRRKANYLAYSGRCRSIIAGTYSITIDLVSDGVPEVMTKLAVQVDR